MSTRKNNEPQETAETNAESVRSSGWLEAWGIRHVARGVPWPYIFETRIEAQQRIDGDATYEPEDLEIIEIRWRKASNPSVLPPAAPAGREERVVLPLNSENQSERK